VYIRSNGTSINETCNTTPPIRRRVHCYHKTTFVYRLCLGSKMPTKGFIGALVACLWWCWGGLTDAGHLLPRDAIPLTVPLSGNLTNTSTHFDPTTWTLFNPVFNQTTWEAQPYVRFLAVSDRLISKGLQWIHRS
jgi:hypothetical protein